jgi:hypothetical protein
MTNPLNRGSAPGRARDASERPGSFKPGHAKLGGRKKGTPNAISANYAWAMLRAAQRVGSDGIGTDGIIGYLKMVLKRYPQVACVLFTRLLLLEDCGWPPDDRTLTKKEINYFIEKPKSGKNSQRLVDDLTRIAAKHPRAFGKLLVALLPQPTSRMRRANLETRRA